MEILHKLLICKENLVSLLSDLEDSSAQDVLELPDSIRDRKLFWKCIKASKQLTSLTEDESLLQPIIVSTDPISPISTFVVEKEGIQPDLIPYSTKSTEIPKLVVDANANETKSALAIPNNKEQNTSVSAVSSLLTNVFSSSNIVALAKPITTNIVAPTVANSLSTNNHLDAINPDSANPTGKLNMHGFAAIQAYLKSVQLTTPFISLGEIGMQEGWSAIPTNAAYCYDNSPIDGWRREVAIRMSGKSRGTTDIHYLPPDKKRRFRKRADLQDFFYKNCISLGMLPLFDFRNAYCVCHAPEDAKRSYLECSFGQAGCNHWMHAECVGLGARTERELRLMPKVTCPFCTYYLKGIGELDSYVKSENILPLVEMTLPAMRINNSNTTNHHNNCGDEEEESQFSDIAADSSEHILWGYQGSSDMVYCHLSRCSILDSNNNSNISNNGNNHNNNSNNHTSVGVYAGDDTAVHGITGVKDDNDIISGGRRNEQQHRLQSSEIVMDDILYDNSSNNSCNSNNDFSQVLQHRLFQTTNNRIISTASTIDGNTDVNNKSMRGRLSSNYNNNNHEYSDDTDDDAEQKLSPPPTSADVREAVFEENEDGGEGVLRRTVQVRITGGWMKNSNSNKSSIKNNNKNTTTTVNNNNNSSDGNLTTLQQQQPLPNLLNNNDNNDDEHAAAIMTNEMRQRIISKAAAIQQLSSTASALEQQQQHHHVNNTTADTTAVAVSSSTSNTSSSQLLLCSRYKNEAIEAAVNKSQSSSNRKKSGVASFAATSASLLSRSLAANNIHPSTTTSSSSSFHLLQHHHETELRESYQAKPSLCYLPVEDGGLRYASSSSAVVPRSLHPLCTVGILCGYCMTYIAPSSNNVPHTSAVNTTATAVTTSIGSSGGTVSNNKNSSNNKSNSSGKPKRLSSKSTATAAAYHDDVAEGEDDDDECSSQQQQQIQQQLVPLTCGVITYRVHKKCAYIANKSLPPPVKTMSTTEEHKSQHSQMLSLLYNNQDTLIQQNADDVEQQENKHITSNNYLPITVGDIYSYEHHAAEDADCDICGRKGGVLVHFTLHPSCSSLSPVSGSSSSTAAAAAARTTIAAAKVVSREDEMSSSNSSKEKDITSTSTNITSNKNSSWLGHIPCILYLQRSKQLEPPSRPPSTTRTRTVLQTSSSSNNSSSSNTNTNVNYTALNRLNTMSTAIKAEDGYDGSNNNIYDSNGIIFGTVNHTKVINIKNYHRNDDQQSNMNTSNNNMLSCQISRKRKRTTTSSKSIQLLQQHNRKHLHEMHSGDHSSSGSVEQEFSEPVLLPRNCTTSMEDDDTSADYSGIIRSILNILIDTLVCNSNTSSIANQLDGINNNVFSNNDDEQRQMTNTEISTSNKISNNNSNEKKRKRLNDNDDVVEENDGKNLADDDAVAAAAIDATTVSFCSKAKLLRNNKLYPGTPQSRFDCNYGHWRCALCGIQCGLALRCIAAGCTVRAHMLCVSIASTSDFNTTCASNSTAAGWQLCNIASNESNNNTNVNSPTTTLGILCSLHSQINNITTNITAPVTNEIKF